MHDAATQSVPTEVGGRVEDAEVGSKGYRGVAMEGSIARWYARTRGSESQRAGWRRQAAAIAASLPDPADVLEIAPGPGYLSVELARTGRLRVTALEISATFVAIAQENARRAGVAVEIRQGDASQMPFEPASFDFLICQAAFKNFSRPMAAIREMYRVLRPGGRAVIQDMHRGARDAEIAAEVRGMQLGAVRAFMTGRALTSLRKRAYSQEQFLDLARTSPFGGAQVVVRGIEIEVTLAKPGRTAPVGPGPSPSGADPLPAARTRAA
ncbi:MAG TPA: class I SAM-dependent methyltransferase [Thermoplasmata archaeon]|nr:class I SAM-dependent methyltransferase [Thermoplasmata archaeon]